MTIIERFLPGDMNFQYFFFSTYPGYFLQVLPLCLIAGLVCGIFRSRRSPRMPAGTVLCSAFFAAYLTGLLSLTLAIKPIGDLWYYLFYRAPSGRSYTWFTFEYYLTLDFFRHFSRENLGNVLMYLPFGILCPLSGRRMTWPGTILAGLLTSLAIELVQPVFGRSFDINDVVLNALGVLLSASALFLLRSLLRPRRKR